MAESKEKIKKVSVICAKGSLEDVYASLVMTNGAIIPNSVLVDVFGIRNDIGLDEIKFISSADRIRRLTEIAANISPQGWQGDRLQALLKETGIDIWFSVSPSTTSKNSPFFDSDQ